MRKRQLTGFLLLLMLLSACNPYHKAVRKHRQLSEREKLTISTVFIEATRYKILGDARNAVDLYQSIIEKDPLHDAALFELAKLKMVMGETDLAEGLFKKAIRVSPDNIWYALGYATLLEKMGKYDVAATQYKSLREKYGDRFELYGYEAQCYAQLKEYQKAIDVYDVLEEVVGVNEESGVQKYYLYQSMGKEDKAMEEIQKLAGMFPENPDYSISLIGYYMNKGMATMALKSINNVLAADPSNVYARTYLADYYHFSGNDAQAKTEISLVVADPAVGIDEKISLLLHILKAGSIYGDTLAIYPMLDTLVQRHPGEAKAWTMYADFLNDADRADEALVMWKKALELDSSRFMIWEMVLNSLYDGQQYDSLMMYASKASELFPEQSTVWFFKGAALYDKEAYREAIVSLEMALDMMLTRKEMKTQTMYLLAESYLKTGAESKSDEEFEKLLGLDAENYVAMNSFAYSLAVRNVNIDKALGLVQKALADNPERVEYLHTYGLILFRQGNYSQAAETYTKAMSLGGENNGALLEHYADALFFLNDLSGALRYWNMAREMGNVGDKIEKKIADKKYYE